MVNWGKGKQQDEERKQAEMQNQSCKALFVLSQMLRWCACKSQVAQPATISCVFQVEIDLQTCRGKLQKEEAARVSQLLPLSVTVAAALICP